MPNKRERIVVLTGAGMSAESGLKTFRGSGGLWEGHKVEDVATPEAWHRDPESVLRFYNERRRQVREAKPNVAHKALVELEADFDTRIITQNIDDLHERAGSSQVLHLHGEIIKSQSSLSPQLVYEVNGTELNIGDRCELGSQLRPFIVWFGEAVPKMEEAVELVSDADIVCVIGTSMVVYPAASLIHFARPSARLVVIDPEKPDAPLGPRVTFIQKPACAGVPEFVKSLRA